MPYKPEAGNGLIFMKVGVHAKETLADILARKRRELEGAGVSFWGYGGNTCHPTTMVQPFVSERLKDGKSVYLCMHEMMSRHYAEPVRANEYSEDGITWKKVPDAINVLGSRYALVVDSLDDADFSLPLSQTRVGVGMQKGRSGSDYVQGRVDKACLELVDTTADLNDERTFKIGVAAKLASPYAVLLR
jgi:hypothetical protein